MKKFLSLLMVLVLAISLVACGDSEGEAMSADAKKVADFVNAHRAELLENFESSFTSGGLTCTSSIRASGTTFIIDVNVNELYDLDAETKAQLQSTFDSMDGVFDQLLPLMQQDLPELTAFTVNVRDRDGNQLASITAN